MKLNARGENISAIEITNIDRLGFWLFDGMKEHYISFLQFPWFENATIKAITTVEKESETHLYWPELDVDLTLDMIDNPDAYPLRFS